MIRATSATLILLTSINLALAEFQKAKPEQAIQIDLKNLGASGNIVFRQANEVKQLPSSVVQLLPDGLANPGERFQVGDVIGKDRLPWRRLVVGATAPGYCLLHYERGGRAKSYLVVLFQVDAKGASLIRASYSEERFSTLPEIKRAVETGQLQLAHNL